MSDALHTEASAEAPAPTWDENLFEVCSSLTELLKTENQALRNHDTGSVASLLERKDKLSRAYERLIKAAQKNPQILAETEEEDRERMREMAIVMETLMAENAQLLTVSIRSGKTLLENIANAVKTTNRGSNTYSRAGSYGPGAQSRATGNLSVSLDRSF